MISALKGIYNFIKMLGSFLVSMVTSLFTLFKYMGNAVSFVVESLGLFPSIMISVIVAGISISIILMIVGRKN